MGSKYCKDSKPRAINTSIICAIYTADVCRDVHKYRGEKSMAFRGADQKSVSRKN